MGPEDEAMAILNWQDHAHTNGSEARAVGGRYRITHRPAYTTWKDEIVPDHYAIQFCRSHTRDWEDIGGIYPTLAEAKRAAEWDHTERRWDKEEHEAAPSRRGPLC
jgi:hypothetical protein